MSEVIMSFDLYVWKWANPKSPGDAADVLEAISEDNPHPAISRFNMQRFEAAIEAEFGEVSDAPFEFDKSDFTGVPANWVSFSIPWSKVKEFVPVICAIAVGQGLAVYDPQEGVVL